MEKIKSILVTSRNTRYYKYYLNGNLNDSHSMKKDDMYNFLCQFIEAPTTVLVYQMMNKFKTFVLDVENSKLYEVSIESQLDKLSKKVKKVNFNKININKLKRKEQSKNIDELLERKVTNIIERLLKTSTKNNKENY